MNTSNPAEIETPGPPPPARVRAGIDVGSNAVKSVVARVEDGRIAEVLREDRLVTRLGEGVDASGRLRPAAIARTGEAVARMARAARDLGAESITAAATSAARDAANANELIRRIRDQTGVSLRILSGEEEARLAFLAVRAAGPWAGPIAVIDPGGGSTEWALGEGDRVTARFSAPVGAVRATERWLRADPPTPSQVADARAGIAGILARAPDPTGRALIGSGGTLHNLASVHQHHAGHSWEAACRLPLAEVKRQIDLFASRPLAERTRIPGLEPARADIILGGALVVEGCCHRAGADTLTVTTYGLRHSLALIEP